MPQQPYGWDVNGKPLYTPPPTSPLAAKITGWDATGKPIIDETKQAAPELTLQQLKVRAEQGQQPRNVAQSEDLLPSVGGALGGYLGGPLGAAAGGTAGEATRQLIARARGREAPATPLNALGQMAGQGALQGVSEGVGWVIGAGGRAIAPRIMQSALKPSVEALKEVTPKGVPKVVQTLLDENVNVSPAGARKLFDILDMTGKKIDRTIDIADKINAPSIYPEAVADRALELTKGLAQQFNNSGDLKIAADSANQFLEEQARRQAAAIGQRPLSPMTSRAAQDIKTGTYRALGGKAFTGELKGAQIEAEKAGAQSLREQLERVSPSLGPLNERWGASAEALDQVARRAGVSGNKDLGGIFWIAHNPAAFLAAQFDRYPAVKSLVANGLYNQAGKVAGVPPALIRLAILSLATQPDDNADLQTQSAPGGRTLLTPPVRR